MNAARIAVVAAFCAVAPAWGQTVVDTGDPGVADQQGVQQAPPSDDSVPQYGGLLSRNYFAVDANSESFRHYPKAPVAVGADLGANVSLTDHLDYNFDYGFEYGKAAAFKLIDNQVGNGLTTFYKFKHFSPFAGAGLGYALDRGTVPNIPGRFDHLFYNVDAGVEFPVGQSAGLRAAVGDDQSVRRPRERDWDYIFGADYWFGSVVGTYLGATLKDGYSGALNAVEYSVGLRLSWD